MEGTHQKIPFGMNFAQRKMWLIQYLIFSKTATQYKSLFYNGLPKSGREDSNLRPLRPERSALAKLSHSPRFHKSGIYHINPGKASYNKLTGSISIETFTAGLIGACLRNILKNLCISSAVGDWTIIWFL